MLLLLITFLTFAAARFSSSAKAQSIAPTAFSRACFERIADVQADRRVCVVGIVRDERTIDVLLSTRETLVGQSVTVYGSRVIQGRRVPLTELGKLANRIVVIGGFIDGAAIYGAKLLSGEP